MVIYKRLFCAVFFCFDNRKWGPDVVGRYGYFIRCLSDFLYSEYFCVDAVYRGSGFVSFDGNKKAV